MDNKKSTYLNYGLGLALGLATFFGGCSPEKKEASEEPAEDTITEDSVKHEESFVQVAEFEGQQVTGVTVTDHGRIFVNFPRWRENVKYAVREVSDDGSSTPYPNEEWNQWEIGGEQSDSVFIAVQSVVAKGDKLYVLDTRNVQFKGVLSTPRIFVFDLNTNQLADIFLLSEEAYHSDSYTNDLRIDEKNQMIYMTDSGHAGLILYNMATGESKRVLDNHESTSAEVDHLTIDGKQWERAVSSDGIALDEAKGLLYYHALSGYSLYQVPTDVLINGSEEEIEAAVVEVMDTSAPDGMILGADGNLYLADLEHHKINYVTPEKEMKTLYEGDKVRWADTFSIYNGYLFYTNSRLHEVNGEVDKMTFSLNKVKL
ncbi:L-dopachrome tautomerase-related protein [Fulvivirga sediminis]|uniref:Major royal jelly protein n=1 Tax=Fulvivirga sediminis TaxID=2803949 RepID=A0A937F779_9BACT|nr:L-dopachrome tautomerase-related protein [Fulvivirga sediminis]MBL3657636.1 hypothetical protein [Fulvivirga sediminis]